MEFQPNQRFSIRKCTIGIASIVIGIILAGPMVAADTVTAENQIATVSAVNDGDARQEENAVQEQKVERTQDLTESASLASKQTEDSHSFTKENELPTAPSVEIKVETDLIVSEKKGAPSTEAASKSEKESSSSDKLLSDQFKASDKEVLKENPRKEEPIL